MMRTEVVWWGLRVQLSWVDVSNWCDPMPMYGYGSRWCINDASSWSTTVCPYWLCDQKCIVVFISLVSISILVCCEGQLDLFHGSNPSEGRVQVCCNNKQKKLDAMMVCRALNLNCRWPSDVHEVAMYLQSVIFSDNSVVALCKTYFGPGSRSILLDNNSVHTQDVSVRCGGMVMVLSMCYWLNLVITCSCNNYCFLPPHMVHVHFLLNLSVYIV